MLQNLTKEQREVVKYVVNLTTAEGELVEQYYVLESDEDSIHFDGMDNAWTMSWNHFGEDMGIDIAGDIRRDWKRREEEK